MRPRDFYPRFRPVLLAVHWLALGLGILGAAVREGSAARVALAALAFGAYVIAVQYFPDDLQDSWPGELLVVAGVAASVGSVALTGGADSPFLFGSLAPTLLGAVHGDTRRGWGIAALGIVGLSSVVALLGQSIAAGPVIAATGVHLLIGVGLARLRRHLPGEDPGSYAGNVPADEAQLRRLSAANDLLLRLSGVADPAELSPVTAGREALDALGEAVKFEEGLIALVGDDGPAVVARTGDEAATRVRVTFPLESGDREVGFVVLARATDLDDRERETVSLLIRPLALAFANILLLRDIARRAVREERMRLARELHDEFGPSLASLGLALDLALLQYPTEPDLGRHLETLRNSVAGLVEEVRHTVTDLREEGRDSLVQRVRGLAAEFTADTPRLVVDLDERRPPRPAIATDLVAILTEAVRNARRHSNSTEVLVRGWVDHSAGEVTVSDDGSGFDTDAVSADRYGLVGMRERASRIGARLELNSAPGAGTYVSVTWGPS